VNLIIVGPLNFESLHCVPVILGDVIQYMIAFYSLTRHFLKIVNMTKPQVVMVLGGPGAGKGTQCGKIVEVSVTSDF